MCLKCLFFIAVTEYLAPIPLLRIVRRRDRAVESWFRFYVGTKESVS